MLHTSLVRSLHTAPRFRAGELIDVQGPPSWFDWRRCSVGAKFKKGCCGLTGANQGALGPHLVQFGPALWALPEQGPGNRSLHIRTAGWRPLAILARNRSCNENVAAALWNTSLVSALRR